MGSGCVRLDSTKQNLRKKLPACLGSSRVWGTKKKVAKKMNHADHQNGGQPPVRLAPSVYLFSCKTPPIRPPEVELALAGGRSFSNLIACGMICVAMIALRPRGGPWVTVDQAPRRARSMRLRSSHIFNGVTRNGHATSLLHHFITIVRTNYCYLQKQKSQCSCELYLSRGKNDAARK